MSLKIYRPILSDERTQGFGENLACTKLDANGKAIRPFQVIPGLYPGTCPVGTTKLYPEVGLKGHNGWDNRLYHGEPVYFPVVFDDPTVRIQVLNEVDVDGGIGVNVYAMDPVAFDSIPVHEPGALKMIERQYSDLGGKLYPMFKFWHLLSTVVPDHGWIKSGDLIGYGDTTGASSGDHLHWCMKIHTGNGFSIDSDNGYTGAFDHAPFFENRFILDVIKPTFRFTKTLIKGSQNADISVLQAVLVRQGYMQPIKAEETGFYGNKTAAGVLAFQIAQNIPLSYYERYILKGSVVGPKTIPKLNSFLEPA